MTLWVASVLIAFAGTLAYAGRDGGNRRRVHFRARSLQSRVSLFEWMARAFFDPALFRNKNDLLEKANRAPAALCQLENGSSHLL